MEGPLLFLIHFFQDKFYGIGREENNVYSVAKVTVCCVTVDTILHWYIHILLQKPLVTGKERLRTLMVE